MIVKTGGKYQVQSESGKNLGTSNTRAEAARRLAQVEWFKAHPQGAGKPAASGSK